VHGAWVRGLSQYGRRCEDRMLRAVHRRAAQPRRMAWSLLYGDCVLTTSNTYLDQYSQSISKLPLRSLARPFRSQPNKCFASGRHWLVVSRGRAAIRVGLTIGMPSGC